jgi:hypothetical protein
MRKGHRDAASELQEAGNLKHWRVSLAGDAIEISKIFGVRRVYAYLLRRGDGTYDLQPTDYEFKPKLSFFNFQKPERRITRNQVFIEAVFRLLRDANMWDIFANKDTYIHVNKDNLHIGDRMGEINNRLKAMLLGAKLVKTRQHKTVTGGKHENKRNQRKLA